MNSKENIKKTKILCTLGPATNTREKITQLAKLGLDCARINFSHGDLESKKLLFETIRAVDDRVAILCDIQGPKIRIGEIKEGGIILRRGNKVILTTDEIVGDEQRLTISYKPLTKEAKVGDLIYINDGIVCLKVEKIAGTELYCKVLSGWSLSSRKGVNLPNTEISLKVPTKKDVADLKFIAQLNPEFVAVSFVGNKEDMNTIRDLLEQYGNSNIKLIAKIERPQAVENFDSILEVSDGIMVARGDLGVELSPEDVPPTQKMMIQKCNRVGKLVIVATQMLESMVKAPTPTRAEVSDVYNAVEDGADAVMLSAETASGDFPLEAVEIMIRIVKSAEVKMRKRNPDDYDSKSGSISELIGHMVFTVCNELSQAKGMAKIICQTSSGYSTKMVSKYRPPLPILGVTHNGRTAREMRLLWGVEPVLLPKSQKVITSLDRIRNAVQFCLKNEYIQLSDDLVMVGNFLNLRSQTNMVTIFSTEDILELEPLK